MKEKSKSRKRLKITAVIICSILLVYLILVIFPRSSNYEHDNAMISDSELPILIAHGGGNKEFPDNTLEAFYNAYSVDERFMMETDVSITKDGVLILSHDVTLDRKTNVSGYISDWNYSDLISQKVDFGYNNPVDSSKKLDGERKKYTDGNGNERSPLDVTYPEGVEPRDDEVFLATTLEELLVAFPNNKINVEIKQSGELGITALNEAIRLLNEYEAFDRVVLASFHEEIYDEFQRLQKEGNVNEIFMCSPAYDGATEFFVLQLLGLDLFFDDKVCVFQLPLEQYGFDLATKGFVRASHRNNMAVHYWTVNDKEEMLHLIDIGADGIMTDYPTKLKTVYEEYLINK